MDGKKDHLLNLEKTGDLAIRFPGQSVSRVRTGHV